MFAKTLSSSVAGQLPPGFPIPELRTTAYSLHPSSRAVLGAAGEFGKTQRAEAEGLFCYSGAIYWSEPTGMANGSRKRGEHRWMVWCGHGPGWHTDVLSASPLLSPGVTAQNWVQQYQNPQAWSAWSQLRALPARAWCCRDVHRKLGLEFQLLHESSSALWPGFSAVLQGVGLTRLLRLLLRVLISPLYFY